jgi:hypothetical protein
LKITAVVEHDRQSLKNYLTGIIDTCPQIDPQMIINYNVNDNNNSNNNNYNNSEFSKEKLNEQRVKNARILNKITNSGRSHNSNINADDDYNDNKEDTTTTNINALNKRKIQETLLDESSQDPDYQQFLEEDRQILSRFRVDDIPVKTISTVLNTVGMVSYMDGYMVGWMDTWMDRWMDKWIDG